MRGRLKHWSPIIPALLLLSFVAGLLRAQTGKQTHDHYKEAETVSASDAPIKITINPEARISVVLAGALPRPVPCGTPVDLQVKILNRGFVTARLEAEFVGDAPTGASLEFPPVPLTGIREELRNLRITLTKPNFTDLTIAFRAQNETPDLGGRDRVHFLMHCLEVQ
jgi:hypothetical protein